MLEETGLGYVLAVPKSQQVPHFGRIDHLFSQAPNEAWERRSCGDGAKGPRVYHWAAVQTVPAARLRGAIRGGAWHDPPRPGDGAASAP